MTSIKKLLSFYKNIFKNLKILKKAKNESDLKVEQEEISLTDISKMEQGPGDETEKVLSLEDVLSKRFYKSSESLTFGACEFGHCLKVEKNGIKINFDREKLNLRYLEINTGENDARKSSL